MNLAAFHDWLFRSIVVAGSASACVMLCPAGLRVRLRRVVQAVPVVAFAVLIALGIGLVRPLPTLEVKTPEIVAQWAAAAGGWIAPWLVRIFAIVAALLLVRTLAGTFAIARLVRQSRPVQGRAWRKLLAECRRTLGMRGNVRLHFAGPGFIPSATGLFRRTVLLPDEAADWSHAQRRLVLLHELGHFRRGDLWTHALGQIACAVHWFNPFVWMLQRHLAVEREFACDALVVSRGAAPVDYATLLWKMGAAAQGPRFANAQSSRAPASASLAMAAAGPRQTRAARAPHPRTGARGGDLAARHGFRAVRRRRADAVCMRVVQAGDHADIFRRCAVDRGRNQRAPLRRSVSWGTVGQFKGTSENLAWRKSCRGGQPQGRIDPRRLPADGRRGGRIHDGLRAGCK